MIYSLQAILSGTRLVFEPGLRRFVIGPVLVNLLLYGGTIFYLFENFGGWLDYGMRQIPDWLTWLEWLIWPLLVVALARPQHTGEATHVPITGRDLMLAVDISPSMEERDMILQGRPLNRLEALKVVLDDFILQREGDRLGLLLFGSEPYIQAPLTFDHETLRTLLSEAGLGMAGRATAIGDAIGLAVKRLRERP